MQVYFTHQNLWLIPAFFHDILKCKRHLFLLGQAYRIGRYPIHFHINGNMSLSYVRGCSIHHTFNRAVNIHDSHNILVEHNVIYHVMGGAMFLEDSAETGTDLQYI